MVFLFHSPDMPFPKLGGYQLKGQRRIPACGSRASGHSTMPSYLWACLVGLPFSLFMKPPLSRSEETMFPRHDIEINSSHPAIVLIGRQSPPAQARPSPQQRSLTPWILTSQPHHTCFPSYTPKRYKRHKNSHKAMPRADTPLLPLTQP